MPESTVEPTELYLDKVENGKARLLYRWNIRQEIEEDETGQRAMWKYNEKVVWWVCPYEDSGVELTTYEAANAYCQNNKADIINFTKGSTVSISKEVEVLKFVSEVSATKEEVVDVSISQVDI